VVTQPDRSSIYPLKIMTSWMRHNTILAPPIVCTRIDPDAPIDEASRRDLEAYYNETAEDRFRSFVDAARRLRAASKSLGPDKLSYKATGYQNKMLDKTEAKRS
jgi:hypothetical protein